MERYIHQKNRAEREKQGKIVGDERAHPKGGWNGRRTGDGGAARWAGRPRRCPPPVGGTAASRRRVAGPGWEAGGWSPPSCFFFYNPPQASSTTPPIFFRFFFFFSLVFIRSGSAPWTQKREEDKIEAE